MPKERALVVHIIPKDARQLRSDKGELLAPKLLVGLLTVVLEVTRAPTPQGMAWVTIAIGAHQREVRPPVGSARRVALCAWNKSRRQSTGV
jgi:hypothetical protein